MELSELERGLRFCCCAACRLPRGTRLVLAFRLLRTHSPKQHMPTAKTPAKVTPRMRAVLFVVEEVEVVAGAGVLMVCGLVVGGTYEFMKLARLTGFLMSCCTWVAETGAL